MGKPLSLKSPVHPTVHTHELVFGHLTETRVKPLYCRKHSTFSTESPRPMEYITISQKRLWDKRYFQGQRRSLHEKYDPIELVEHEKTNGTFIKTDHLLGHKASLNKFRRTGIMWILLSDYSTINGDLVDKKDKSLHTWT